MMRGDISQSNYWYTMSEIADSIQAKCLAFSDRIIKLNDYLLKEAANTKPAFKVVKGKRVYEKPIPVYLQSVANISNQYQSIYNDAEELVKILVTRCKTLNAEEKKE